jgi:hypothetical protein
MSSIRESNHLSDEEWLEMVRLKREIDTSLSACCTAELERFSELFSRSILGKGDCRNYINETVS